MRNINAWPWKGIWQAIGALAAVMAIAYFPYVLLHGDLNRLEESMDEQFQSVNESVKEQFKEVNESVKEQFKEVNDKLANIDKRLAVVEDRLGIPAPPVPVKADSTLAPRAGSESVALSVLESE